MERRQLLALSGWSEEYLHDLINKKIKSGVQFITNAQYAVIFATLQEMDCPLYATLEDVLRNCMPAVIIPKKWANVTRSVLNKINKNHNVNDVVHQLTTKENSEHISHDNYLGKVCDCLGINKSTLMFPPTNMAKTLLTVEAFYEICLFKNLYGHSWGDVAKWINHMIPEGMKLNKNQVLYMHKKIKDNFHSYMKNRKHEELNTFKSCKFFKYVNSILQPKSKMTDIERKNKSLGSVCVKLDTNQKQILCENQQLNLENEALREKICEQKGNLTEFELDLLWKNQELKKLRLTKRKNETLQHENQSLKENITFIKKENFYKQLRRKQSKIERKEREIKDKNKAITKENKDLKIRARTLETNIVDKRTENKVKMHKISNRCSHAKKINKKLKQKLHNKNVEMENKQYENLNLIKQIKAANEQINIFESEANNEHFSTKDGPRYSDDMRTCIMDLQGSDIPANKISNVINVVSNTLFYRNPSDLPCRSTISNICDEGHVLAKQHISETLANCQQFDIFSDGTCREGKKILDLGVHTLTGTLSLGFKSVAKENSETVAETIKETLKEFAELEHDE